VFRVSYTSCVSPLGDLSVILKDFIKIALIIGTGSEGSTEV